MLRAVIILFVCLFFFVPIPVFAQEPNFAVSRETIYNVSDNGQTQVTQNFTLTNLTSDFFPQGFTFRLPKDNIIHLTASDRLGPLAVDLKTQADTQEIRLSFRDEVLGLGRILRFTVSYQTDLVAKRQGRLWSVFIPSASPLPGETTSAIRLIVPTSFGTQIFTKPKPATSDLFWTKDDLGNSAIETVFDPKNQDQSYQAFDFDFAYQLYNSRLYPAVLKIAIAPDTDYQKIFLTKISPKPSSLVVGNDGNWEASYLLGPTARLAVSVVGSAAVYLSPHPSEKSPETKKLLGPQKFWPTNDSAIKNLAQKLTSPKAIYDYVLSALEYHPDTKASRLGARAALQNANRAGSSDFTDLFVTLARTAGIPSREVAGYFQGQLHIWPEYFDQTKNTWVMIDPALGKIKGGEDYFSTFDFAHLSLTQNGLGQSLSLPDKATIRPVDKDLNRKLLPAVTASFNIPQNTTAGFSTVGKIFIENHGPTLFSPEALSLSSDTFSFENQVFLTGVIPPFGSQEIEARILPTPALSQTDGIISLKFGSTRQDYHLTAVPLYKNAYLLIFVVLLILGLISIITQLTWGLLFQKRQGRGNLRGKGQ